jgi:hypothetical protein
MTAGRVGADITQPDVQGDQHPSGCGGGGHHLRVGRAAQPLLADSVDVVTGPAKMAADEAGRFSSSLNFTATAAAAAAPRALAPHRKRPPRARPQY